MENLKAILSYFVGEDTAKGYMDKYATRTLPNLENFLGHYRERMVSRFRKRFFNYDQNPNMNVERRQEHAETTPNRERFINDHRIDILEGTCIELKYHLHPRHFRGSAEKSSPVTEAENTGACWLPLGQSMGGGTTDIGDADALLYCLDPTIAEAAGIKLEKAKGLQLHRTVVVSDSGYGKTVRLEWLLAELCRRKSRKIPFLLDVDELLKDDDQLLQCLLSKLTAAGTRLDLETLKTLREAGQIFLLLDATDQAGDLDTLREIVGNKAWQKCGIVVSGRPEAFYESIDIFTSANEDQSERQFRFVKPLELTDDQVGFYIGEGRISHLKDQLDEVQDILRNPRVAYYLGYVIPGDTLSKLKSASDVFEEATEWLLRKALAEKSTWRLGIGFTMRERAEKSVPPRGFQPERVPQVDRAKLLLSAIAFEQLSLRPEGSAEVSDGVPNFSNVKTGDLPSFLNRVFVRVKTVDKSRYDTDLGVDYFYFDLDRLSEANVLISRGLLDTISLRREICWRNKSLHEFYAARWLANHATDDDIGYLTKGRYHPLRPNTFSFYWVQRFLCEMPRHAGVQSRWASAVEPFFRPGDGTVEGTHRSCEMIYRAWRRLVEVAESPCETYEATVRDRFLGEFMDILGGQYDGIGGQDDTNAESDSEKLKPSEAAKELKDSFVDIPAGRFRMGAPDDRQGMGPQYRSDWEAFINRYREEKSLEAFLEVCLRELKDRSRTDAQLIQWYRQQYTRVFHKGVQIIEDWQFPHDETPGADCAELDIDPFLLSRYPVLNRWYRLFDPGHGIDGSPYEDYATISGTEDRPLIYADWYMSWCFALFCHWDGRSCELPGEDQWEYAAKAERTVVSWPEDYRDFWWGDDFEKGRHHCTSHATQTSAPPEFTKAKAQGKHHENPFGLVDMLGNVWEWTGDRYRSRYSRTATEGKSSAFVLRGGSWGGGDATFLRCGRRFINQPTYSNDHTGCRLSRVARAENLEPSTLAIPCDWFSAIGGAD